MIPFCGQDKCTLDANGRVKLSPHFLRDFRAHGSEVVTHCLPEGALGIYPVSVWRHLREASAATGDCAIPSCSDFELDM